ncbi:RNA-binding protein [Endozoicomonas sp. (ex Bugula neritina AB1)]|nr:RNA-binding protein [Endozoicomonas sp. (ex Bugula neritina AB1)]
MQKRTLYIGNLAYTAVEEDLEQAFEVFGEIEDIKLMRDRETDRPRGFAFITFEKEAEAEAAMVMDGKEVAGRPLRVNRAKDKQNNKRPHSNSHNNHQANKTQHQQGNY